MKSNPSFLVHLACVAVMALVFYAVGEDPTQAAAPSLSVSLTRDSNHEVIQVPPTALLYDGTVIAATVNNLALTTNVVTITTAANHNFVVGQRVTVNLLTGPALFADVNGSFIVATTPSGTTFTYALTHTNITTGAATGTAIASQASPVPTGTTPVTVVFPPGSFALTIMPTAAVTDCTFTYTLVNSRIQSNAGTFHLIPNVANNIAGTEGDVIVVTRGTTTPLDFQFSEGK